MRSLLIAGCLLIGCGSSSIADATAVDSAAQDLQALVVSHTNSTTASNCATEMQTYQRSAEKLLATMRGMCPGLDTCRAGMGHGDGGMMMDRATGLQHELDAHVASGCSSADLSTELTRHHDAMISGCSQLHTDATEVMGMGGMMSGHGCH